MKKRKCKNCKHTNVPQSVPHAFSADEIPGIHHYCDLKNGDEVEHDGKCWRYIKFNGLIHNIQKHWLKHWQFWIKVFLAIFAILATMGVLNMIRVI